MITADIMLISTLLNVATLVGYGGVKGEEEEATIDWCDNAHF